MKHTMDDRTGFESDPLVFCSDCPAPHQCAEADECCAEGFLAAKVDDLCTAPGAADLTFGGLLTVMIGEMFLHVETLDSAAPHRFYLECKQCEGTDNERPRGQRRQIHLVKHTPDCSLGRHMPRLLAMANKDVT
jgi:hypothetical protein